MCCTNACRSRAHKASRSSSVSICPSIPRIRSDSEWNCSVVLALSFMLRSLLVSLRRFWERWEQIMTERREREKVKVNGCANADGYIRTKATKKITKDIIIVWPLWQSEGIDAVFSWEAGASRQEHTSCERQRQIFIRFYVCPFDKLIMSRPLITIANCVSVGSCVMQSSTHTHTIPRYTHTPSVALAITQQLLSLYKGASKEPTLNEKTSSNERETMPSLVQASEYMSPAMINNLHIFKNGPTCSPSLSCNAFSTRDILTASGQISCRSFSLAASIWREQSRMVRSDWLSISRRRLPILLASQLRRVCWSVRNAM